MRPSSAVLGERLRRHCGNTGKGRGVSMSHIPRMAGAFEGTWKDVNKSIFPMDALPSGSHFFPLVGTASGGRGLTDETRSLYYS